MLTGKNQQALNILNLNESPVSGNTRNDYAGHKCKFEIKQLCFVLTKENIPLTDISNPPSIKFIESKIYKNRTDDYFNTDHFPFKELHNKCDDILNRITKLEEDKISNPFHLRINKGTDNNPHFAHILSELTLLLNDIQELSIVLDSKARMLKGKPPGAYIQRAGECVRAFAYILKEFEGFNADDSLSDKEINQLNSKAWEALMIGFPMEGKYKNKPLPTFLNSYFMVFRALCSEIKNHKFYLE